VEFGRWDMTYGGFGITEDRLVKFDFVTTYQSTKFFFGPKQFKLDNYPQDLAGVRVGAEAGTKFVEHLQALSDFLVSEGLSPINIIELEGIEEIEAALLDGTITLTPTGEEVVTVLKTKPGFENFDARGPEIISSFLGSVFGRGDGLVFRKGDRARYLFERSLQHMLYNCDYAKIEKRYLTTVNAYTPQHCR
jgi:ABC-type amino acid transport substrate-binding protein